MFWFPRRPPRAIRQAAAALYQGVIAQARQPLLYQAPYHIPDTFDGRFDNIIMHNSLLMHRMQHVPNGLMLNQALFDCMFQDFEHNNRHIGVGDMSILRHFRRMTAAFNGRRTQYFSFLDQKDAYGLATALARNVYRQKNDEPYLPAIALAEYVFRQQEGLCSQPDSVIMNGEISWQRANRSTDNSRGNQTTQQASATAA